MIDCMSMQQFVCTGRYHTLYMMFVDIKYIQNMNSSFHWMFFLFYLHVGLQYCWGFDTSSDVEVYQIGGRK